MLKPLSLPADCALALAQLPVEQLFGDAVVSDACDVSCPSDLSLAHDGDDSGDFRTLKKFCVRDFVLPKDVKEVPKASEMETVNLFFMASVDGPCFAAIQ